MLAVESLTDWQATHQSRLDHYRRTHQIRDLAARRKLCTCAVKDVSSPSNTPPSHSPFADAGHAHRAEIGLIVPRQFGSDDQSRVARTGLCLLQKGYGIVLRGGFGECLIYPGSSGFEGHGSRSKSPARTIRRINSPFERMSIMRASTQRTSYR